MAELIPDFNFCLSRMTSGEKRFASMIKEKLEDDYLCWYDVPIGWSKIYPDFIILHPRRGILILEVKDWKLENIKHATPATITLMTSDGVVKKKNPFEQAKKYAHAVVNLLEKDKTLISKTGNFQGKLLFPWGYGVVFSNITRKIFDSTDLKEIFSPHLVICKDEITESVDAESFQEQLWGMFNYSFGKALTMPQIDRVRWNLFPEVRIDTQPSLFTVPEKEAVPEPELIPDIMRVMDLQQEQLARSLGNGHRVIHGVSGSGKTLILCYRSIHLAEQFDKPILVLCFNIALAIKLYHMIAAKGLSERVIVRHFHKWCFDQMKLYNVPLPSPNNSFFNDMVQSAVKAVEQGQIPTAQYGAVMIDEGHDFNPDWLKLAVQMVDPSTDSLLLLYDSAQSIYKKSDRLGFSLSSVGIKARGRTTILRINYRNTAEILSFAYSFANDIFAEDKQDKDSIPIVRPESAGRHGAVPDFVRLHSLQDESLYLTDRFHELNKNGIPWSDMAVIYRQNFIGGVVTNTFRRAGIPVEWLNESKQSRYYNPNADSVKVVTMQSSKGLEFPAVAIPGLGYMPQQGSDYQVEAKLLYVAMTRAVDNLILTTHRDSDFTVKLNQARSQIAVN